LIHLFPVPCKACYTTGIECCGFTCTAHSCRLL
jgi:hypothetical protein